MARIVQIVFSACIVWATLISSLPLVASIALLSILLSYTPLYSTNSSAQVLELFLSGEVRYGLVCGRCKRIWFLYKTVMIRIVMENGHYIDIWRDACDEESYRRALALLSVMKGNKV